MSIAAKALEAHLASDDGGDSSEGEGEGTAPSLSREALREAFDAVSKKDFDGFADAIEALVEIKLASR